MKLSFIIPVYNEKDNVRRLAAQASKLEADGHEVVLIDGGSQDQTLTLAQQLGCKVITSEKGRARIKPKRPLAPVKSRRQISWPGSDGRAG